jgi:hypothetical protein
MYATFPHQLLLLVSSSDQLREEQNYDLFNVAQYTLPYVCTLLTDVGCVTICSQRPSINITLSECQNKIYTKPQLKLYIYTIYMYTIYIYTYISVFSF